MKTRHDDGILETQKDLSICLKHLNNWHYWSLVNKYSWQMNTLEYKNNKDFCTPYMIRSTMEYSFLQIEVRMADLWPLINHCKFMKWLFFALSFIMKISVYTVMLGFYKSGHIYHNIMAFKQHSTHTAGLYVTKQISILSIYCSSRKRSYMARLSFI